MISNKQMLDYFGVSDFPETKDFPKLTLQHVKTDFLDKVYALTEESYSAIFSSDPNFALDDVLKYFAYNDNICLVVFLDPSTKNQVIRHLGFIFSDVSYCLSLMHTILSQFSYFTIKCEVYDESKLKDEDCSEACKDMLTKYKKVNTYEFWKSLNTKQQQKIIDWYNSKPTDHIMFHPYYKWNMMY